MINYHCCHWLPMVPMVIIKPRTVQWYATVPMVLMVAIGANGKQKDAFPCYMCRMDITKKRVCIAAVHLQARNILNIMNIYDQMSSADVHVLIFPKKRCNVPKVTNYFEETIPSYSPGDFKSHFRMSREAFEETCSVLSTLHQFNKTRGPRANVEKNLLMFLWYIGNLESFRSIADRFGVSKSTLHESVRRTSSALVELMPRIIKWPQGPRIDETSRQFAANSQFQNVIGVIDGSHIPIKAPTNQPHAYFNRKKYYSLVLLATCNAELEFTYVWTGNPRSTHDATVLRQSDLFGECDQRVPPYYYLLGDSAFPIQRWLITPFRDCGNLTMQQKLFNRTHSRCRQVIERAFGMLKCRFRRLLRFDASDMSLLVDSILAACVLHNLCLHVNDMCEVADEEERADGQDCELARQGHDLQGLRIRQQLMQQLV